MCLHTRRDAAYSVVPVCEDVHIPSRWAQEQLVTVHEAHTGKRTVVSFQDFWGHYIETGLKQVQHTKILSFGYLAQLTLTTSLSHNSLFLITRFSCFPCNCIF